jgi:cell shape-determining protein MreD
VRNWISPLLWLIFAAALQGSLANRVSVGWVKPDFLLVTAVALSMRGSVEASAGIGFVAGLFDSALWNERIAAFTISRMFACVVATRVYQATPAAGPWAAAVVTGAATLVADILFLFLGIPSSLVEWLVSTLGGILYNAALALVVYALQSRWAGRRSRTKI